MLYCAKKTLALLITAGLMGGISSAQAVLKEGEFAGSVGATYMLFDDSQIKFTGLSAAQAGFPIDQKVKFKNDDHGTSMSFDVLYMVTNDIAIDFGLFWPATVKQKVRHPDVTTDGKYHFDIMPVHLSARYFFMSPQDSLRPYVGLGGHYTDFRKAKIRDERVHKMNLDKSYGWLGQVGLVYGLSDLTFVDASVSYYDLEPDGDAKFKIGGTTYHKVKVKDAKLSPVVFNISLGLRF